eukprot:TRINITY_DN31526_c0_g1_i2.p1 TRINITY_DN31526_c0_g1~~TRINITY_DN31526_c0_g1_i2.p1  ORF type:complete len:700 (+),score=181.70 TRINITY_DN31526_c0_g1_i2:19-2118(+)
MPIRNSPQRAPKSSAGEVTAYRHLISELFALYDLREDGQIQEDAFSSTQHLVSRVLRRTQQEIVQPLRPSSSWVGVNKSPFRVTRGHSGGLELLENRIGFSRCGSRSGLELAGSQVAGAQHPSISVNMSCLEADLKGPSPVRSPSFTALERGKGFLTKDEFFDWQMSLLSNSKKSFVVKRTRLEWLVAELEKMDKTVGQSKAWREREAVCRALRKRAEEAQALRREGSAEALGSAIDLLQKAVDEAEAGVISEGLQLRTQTQKGSLAQLVQLYRQQIEAWHSEREELEEEGLPLTLNRKSVDSSSFGEDSENVASASQATRLLSEQEASFRVHIAQESGEDLTIQAKPENTVGMLRAKVADELGIKPYRVLLRHQGTGLERRDSLKLAETGMTEELSRPGDAARLALNLAPVDKWREASKDEMIEAAMQRGLLSNPCPELSEEEVRSRFALSLKQADKEDEDRLEKERLRLERRDKVIEAARLEAAVLAADPDQLAAKAADVEQAISKITEEATYLEAEIASTLGAARDDLDQAGSRVQTLSANDVDHLANMAHVPQAVIVFAQALCILFQRRPAVKIDDHGSRYHDYWSCAKELLADTELFARCQVFDRDGIPDHIVQRLIPYIEESNDFRPEEQRNYSKTGYTFCLWIRATVAYHQAKTDAATKQQVLDRLREELDEAKAALDVWHEAARRALGLAA